MGLKPVEQTNPAFDEVGVAGKGIGGVRNKCIVQYNFMAMKTKTPTNITYAELDLAYKFFNKALFGGELPDCLITLKKSTRSWGYFSPDRFRRQDGAVTDEISLNPRRLTQESVVAMLSTLVHEMVHLRQKHFGKPGRGRYHNKEWGRMMKEVGLYPSNTGLPGGREVGDRMTHYIIAGGPFDRASQKLLSGEYRLTWQNHTPEISNPRRVHVGSEAPGTPTGNRWKYTCPECGLNAWGKPNIKLVCGACGVTLIAG